MILDRANRNIARLAPYVPGKPIDEVRREYGLSKVVKLASNENPYGPAPKVLKAMAAAAGSVNRYPDGTCYELRQVLARRLGVAPVQLVFGCGSDEIIVLSIRTFVEPGDEVVVAKPSFLVYSIAAAAAGARVKEVPLRGLDYDLGAMAAAVTRRTKIIFVGNPDNPSGRYANRASVAALLKAVPRDVLVFFDEAYFEYVSAEDYPDTLALLRRHENVIVARTFSKLYGLAGLRIGYGIARPGVAALLDRAREPFNVTSVAQAAALAALASPAYYRRILREQTAERERLSAGVERLGLEVSRGCTNFVQVRLPGDSGEVARALLRRGVIVRDMAVWGLQRYIRVSIGTPEENRMFLASLRAVLA